MILVDLDIAINNETPPFTDVNLDLPRRTSSLSPPDLSPSPPLILPYVDSHSVPRCFSALLYPFLPLIAPPHSPPRCRRPSLALRLGLEDFRSCHATPGSQL